MEYVCYETIITADYNLILVIFMNFVLNFAAKVKEHQLRNCHVVIVIKKTSLPTVMHDFNFLFFQGVNKLLNA